MTHLVRHLLVAGSPLVLAAFASLPSPALGQSPASPAGVPEPSVSERVKKDAASPLYWIRLNAQKADGSPAKPAPRIAEIRPVAPAPRPVQAPVPAGGGGGGNPTAGIGGGAPAAAAPGGGGETTVAAEATGVLAAPPALAAPNPAAAAAAMVAPAASSAADAARAAAAAAAEPEEPDEPLTLTQANEPEFPVNMMRRLRKGTVQVRFDVQPDGSVANVVVVQTSNRGLNQSAIEAVSGWRFKPVRSPRSAVVDLGFDLDS